MKRENISKAMDGVGEHLIVEAAEKLDLVGAPVAVKAGKKGQNAFVRFLNSGWGVAAVCALVAVGVMGGIIWAGNQPGTHQPAGATEETETEAEVTEPLVIPETEETTAEEATSEEATSEEVTTQEIETEPPHEHILGEWSFAQTPTCTESGVWERRCTAGDCNYTEERSLPAGRHTFNDTQLTCVVCGADAPPMEFTSYGDGTCYISDRGEVARSIRELTIPSYSPEGDLVIAVDDNVFSDLLERCSKLTISEGIERIGVRAFAAMPMLKEVQLPSTLKRIEDSAFFYCGKLADVVLPVGLQYIGDSAFESCRLSESFVLPEGLWHLGANAFANCTALTKIHLPSSLTEIGEGVFVNHISLTEITFDENIQITAIPAKFAQNCRITAIRIPDSVTSIGNNAFLNCAYLQDVSLPDGLTEIGHGAFNGCFILAELDLPASLTSIGDSAFADCTALSGLVLPEALTHVGVNVFDGASGLSYQTYGGCLYLPIGENSYAVLVKAESTEITAAEIHPDVKLMMGGAFEECTHLEEITIPGGQTEIPNRFFYGCTSLRAVELPDTVTSIGEHAFYRCAALAKLPESAGLTQIGAYAFSACHGLTEIVLPETVTEVGVYAFSSCGNLLSATLSSGMTSVPAGMFHKCALLERATLPESITRIEDWAFGWMDMNNATYFEINIPKTVVYMGGSVFSDGTVTMRYDGTWAEFDAIEKGESCFGGRGHAAVVCSDGTVYLS